MGIQTLPNPPVADPSVPDLSSRPVVIVTITHEYGETGVQTHYNTFSAYLKAHGVEVKVLTPFSEPRPLVYPVFAPRRAIQRVYGPLGVWWYRYWHGWFLGQALRKTLRQLGPALIYAQCPVSARIALQERRPDDEVAMVVQFNVSQADEWAGKGALRQDDWMFRAIRQLEAETLPQLNRIVYVSQFLRSSVEARIPALAAVPAVVLPNFVGPPDAPPPGYAAADLISVGTLEPRKNQAYLLSVLAEANQLGYRYRLTLVGHGPDRSHLERMAERLGVRDQVQFLGFQRPAARFMRGHRAYVHGAVMDNLPVALVEALSVGLPILAAPVGGIPEIVRDGVEGGHWPLDNPRAGAERLIQVLEDPATYAAASQAAHVRYAEHFSTDAVAGRLHHFLSTSGAAAPSTSGQCHANFMRTTAA